MSTQEIKHNIDVDTLANIGRATVDAREAQKREQSDRYELERQAELLNEWKPFVDAILDSITEWIPEAKEAEFADMGVMGNGWSIVIPNTDPVSANWQLYFPMTLMLDNCSFIYAWTDCIEVAFEATTPAIHYDETDGIWKTQLRARDFGLTKDEIKRGESNLTVAIFKARQQYSAWMEAIAETERRNARPDSQPERRIVPLIEAEDVLRQLISDGANNELELWHIGVLAALVAIADRTGHNG